MLQKNTVSYDIEEIRFESVLFSDSGVEGKRPGVLIFPNFMGLSSFDEEKAIEILTNLGFVTFCVDMYGVLNRPIDKDSADLQLSLLNNNRPELLRRATEAVSQFIQTDVVDENKIAAIGFCFGGKCVLDLARATSTLKGVASFHGVYDQPNYPTQKEIKTSILVFHGWEDPLANPEQMKGLADELTAGKADWSIQIFGSTGHAFTNPKLEDKKSKFFFQEKANAQSWQALEKFLIEQLEK